jgi:hypothetical protein
LLVDDEMASWRQQGLGMHVGDQLNVNDFGCLARSNFNYGRWRVRKHGGEQRGY